VVAKTQFHWAMCGLTQSIVQLERVPKKDGSVAIEGFMMSLTKSTVNIRGWNWSPASISQSTPIPQSMARLMWATAFGGIRSSFMAPNPHWS
jgi:hypothetical protein